MLINVMMCAMTKIKHGLCDFAQRAQNQNIMIFALASNVSDFLSPTELPYHRYQHD